MAWQRETMDLSETARPNRAVRRADRLFHGIVAAGLAAMFAGSLRPMDLAALPPTFGVGAGGGSICLLWRMTHMPCPTCGITRSFYALAHGAPREAVAFHPLGPVFYALLAVVMVRSAGVALRGRTWLDRTARVLVWSIPVLAVATLVVYAVRMTLFFSGGTGGEAWRTSPLGRLIALLS